MSEQCSGLNSCCIFSHLPTLQWFNTALLASASVVLALVIRDPSLSSCSCDKQGYLCISVSSGANETVRIQIWVYRIRDWLSSVTCRSEPNIPLLLWRCFTGRELPLSSFIPQIISIQPTQDCLAAQGTDRNNTEKWNRSLLPPPRVDWELSSLQVAGLIHLNFITRCFLCLPSGTCANEWQKWPGTTKVTDWKGWGNPQ